MNAPNLSPADWRAELNWLKYREQKEYCEQCNRLEASPVTIEQIDAAYAALFAIEEELEADIGASVLALGAVLTIEIEDEESEDIPGLYRATLSAIRPQLTGAIAEAADRALLSAPLAALCGGFAAAPTTVQ